jgi:hypothetical protein
MQCRPVVYFVQISLFFLRHLFYYLKAYRNW